MTMTIGQVAERVHVNVQTVRYYERRGLLPEPPRTASGYRQYDAEAVRRIGFIKRAQGLGFTLEEITELLDLRVDPEGSCDSVEARAERTITRIEAKIADLERMRDALTRLAHDCRHRRASDDCPILVSLEEDL